MLVERLLTVSMPPARSRGVPIMSTVDVSSGCLGLFIDCSRGTRCAAASCVGRARFALSGKTATLLRISCMVNISRHVKASRWPSGSCSCNKENKHGSDN